MTSYANVGCGADHPRERADAESLMETASGYISVGVINLASESLTTSGDYGRHYVGRCVSHQH